MNKVFSAAVALSLFGILLLASIGNTDVKDERLFIQEYCELSSMWLDDKARGVDEFERRGHPPYKREIDCAEYGFTK